MDCKQLWTYKKQQTNDQKSKNSQRIFLYIDPQIYMVIFQHWGKLHFESRRNNLREPTDEKFIKENWTNFEIFKFLQIFNSKIRMVRNETREEKNTQRDRRWKIKIKTWHGTLLKRGKHKQYKYNGPAVSGGVLAPPWATKTEWRIDVKSKKRKTKKKLDMLIAINLSALFWHKYFSRFWLAEKKFFVLFW